MSGVIGQAGMVVASQVAPPAFPSSQEYRIFTAHAPQPGAPDSPGELGPITGCFTRGMAFSGSRSPVSKYVADTYAPLPTTPGMVLNATPPGANAPMLSRFCKSWVYSPRIPNGPLNHEKNPLYRSTPPLMRNCGKKVYVPSVKRPLKLSSFERPLDRLCSAEPPKDNPFRR